MIDHKGLYFQFPVCLLATRTNYRTLLNWIITYGLKEVGNRLDSESRINDQTTNAASRAKFVEQYNASSELSAIQFHIAWGAEALRITIPSLEQEEKDYLQMAEWVKTFGDSGKALCRIRKDWIFDSRDKGMLDEREFCILVAIYSAIGNKQFRRITREEIRRRSCGYASKAQYLAAIDAKQEMPWDLTDSQIRTTVAKLHQLKFFAKVTYAQRISYYTHRLPVDDLVNAVKERLIKRHEDKSRHQEINRSLTEDIRAAKRDLVKVTQRPMG